jgi:hypothetical protein
VYEAEALQGHHPLLGLGRFRFLARQISDRVGEKRPVEKWV